MAEDKAKILFDSLVKQLRERLHHEYYFMQPTPVGCRYVLSILFRSKVVGHFEVEQVGGSIITSHGQLDATVLRVWQQMNSGNPSQVVEPTVSPRENNAPSEWSEDTTFAAVLAIIGLAIVLAGIFSYM